MGNSFIDSISAAAQAVGKEYNVLPSLLIAQACLESNYGQSGLAINGKNLFGVKGAFNGQSVQMHTNEFENGKLVDTIADFRKYPSYIQSFTDLGELYKNGVSWDHAKYSGVIGQKDISKACTFIGGSGYSTNPNYGGLLLNIVKQYNLTQYDPQPVRVASVGELYVVKPGDTLSGILGTSNPGKIISVCKANKIDDPDKIFVGQHLYI